MSTESLTVVQTCLLHLIRRHLLYASRRDWDAMAKDLRPVYTAINAKQAGLRLEESPSDPSTPPAEEEHDAARDQNQPSTPSRPPSKDA